MTAGTVLSIVSAILALARWFTNYAQQQKWIAEGVAQVILQSLKDSDDAIARAKDARDLVRANAARDPASVLRDDDGFKRTGD